MKRVIHIGRANPSPVVVSWLFEKAAKLNPPDAFATPAPAPVAAVRRRVLVPRANVAGAMACNSERWE